LHFQVVSQQLTFPQGAGNLPTMKFAFLYRSPIAMRSGPRQLSYSDMNFPGRAGWKEIVVSADPSVHLSGAASWSSDRSSRLSEYPADLLNSPPQDVMATVEFQSEAILKTRITAPKPITGKAPPAPSPSASSPPAILPPAATPRNAFTELMAGKQVGLGFMLIAALLAAGLGALHALEPGHGKTIVAAYLVGSRGTARHALLLGVLVTVSHTAGVYLLGGVTLYAQKYIMPDRLYPYLGVISGLLIAGMGLYLLLKVFAGADFQHAHGPGGHQHGMISGRGLAMLGITGGIVPCPAALVVLLSAVALHRVAFGLYLIVAFSLGLAMVLVAMGMTAVYAGRLVSRLRFEGPLVHRWLPVASAAIITVVGCAIAVRALTAAGIVQIRI
jgi:ABC-type nickel/cobalt efflux system permease component RcnA